MYRPFVSLLAVFLIYLLFSLCLPTSAPAGENGSHTVQRIVSLGPINTENVFLLGAGDLLVGNTTYCVRPEAAKQIEKIGSVMQFSLEKIISLHPDLVLATGLTRPGQVKKLRQHGITTVHFRQPASFTEICDQFLRLGQMLHRSQRAKQIVAEAKKKVKTIVDSVASLPRQRVFLQVGASPLFSSTKQSFTNDFIELGGGINIAEENIGGMIHYEQVIVADPQVIIIAMMGSEYGAAAEEKKHWLQADVIDAVRNHRVHIINPNLVCSPSPTTFAETLDIIAGLVHPERDDTTP